MHSISFENEIEIKHNNGRGVSRVLGELKLGFQVMRNKFITKIQSRSVSSVNDVTIKGLKI